jgi:DNA polymerase I-like protein with 3'-5' exonuclease and polymerase domains/5'-3' exonuclease
MAEPQRPASPRLFLVDGYALIYRAFFALLSRPLTTSRGENTSAAWGIVNFLQRLHTQHRPEYLAWVNDSGTSFRHERFPAYKATRQKLSEELQSAFDRGMERICSILEASRIPIITLEGFEADDVIGALARQGVERNVNVVIVSGDKDFQQLVRPGVWLLNPGRGGPAGVDEQWVGGENASERLGVPPERVTDYMAMVGDTSDNVPGVPGIGEKTARELVATYGGLEDILAHASEITKKRPREALLAHGDRARLSKELVTIRDDLPVTLDLDAVRVQEPDSARLRDIYVELEFHSLAMALPTPAPVLEERAREVVDYRAVDTLQDLRRLVAEVRSVGRFAIDTETVIDPDAPIQVDPLRSTLVGISIAIAPGKAYYLPLKHRAWNEAPPHPPNPPPLPPRGKGGIDDLGGGPPAPDNAAIGSANSNAGMPAGVPPAADDTTARSRDAHAGLAGGLPAFPSGEKEGMGDLWGSAPAADDAHAGAEGRHPPGREVARQGVELEGGGGRGRLVAAARTEEGREDVQEEQVTLEAELPAASVPAGDSIAARTIAAGELPPLRNLPPLDAPEMRALRELLEDAAIKKTAQHAKYDVLALRRAGVELRGVDFDTMLASYVLDPGRRSHGLDVLAFEFLNHTMTTFDELCGKGKSQLPFDMIPVSCARDYSCEDADMTLRLRAVFEPQLDAHEMTPLFRNIETPLVEVLTDMEWTGISIDVAWFRSLKERFQRERERVEQEIYAEAGQEFNINSNPQLRVILFEKLQLPIRKRTATGPSTDASVLQELAEAGHVLPQLLLEYRELFKLEGTYLDALPQLLNPADGRLHTSFNQTVASTGRLSSSDPNLQNIPIRRELGRDIRRGFVPRADWMLLAADYSQIELRLLAHLSRDEAFVHAFTAGGDIHRQTASIIFDVPLAEVTPVMRARAKTINFATIYGQGAHALSRQLKIEHAEAREFIARYFERFQGVRKYLDAMIESARELGYVQTIFGRRRYIPELRDRNYNVRAFGERTAQNSPIQGSAADLIKIAMIRIHDQLRAKGLEAKMLLQVHDELVFDSPMGELDALRALVVHEMEHAAELSVPLVVDVGVGRDWLETKIR